MNPYYLQISLSKGQILLNSNQANQSNAQLKHAFHEAFQRLEIYGQSFDNILMLGGGLGSVVSLLQERCRIESFTIIENDSRIITWLQEYYDIKELKIMSTSANELNLIESYDFIIVDLFVDTNIPEFLNELSYWQMLKLQLTKKGRIIWNTLSKPSEQIQSEFDEHFQVQNGNVFYYYQNKN